MGRTKKAWINGLFFVITLVVNTLGAIGIINGLSQKQISDMYITLITPSPFTFSIWSIIYLSLLASVIVMIVRKNDPYYQMAVDKISVLFRISCILNIVWIVAFSYVQLELSVLFILAFAITLSLICLKLVMIQEGKRWLLPLTFGLRTPWAFEYLYSAYFPGWSIGKYLPPSLSTKGAAWQFAQWGTPGASHQSLPPEAAA